MRGRRRVAATVGYNRGMAASAVETRTLLKVRQGQSDDTTDDWVVVEEPLEIRVGGETLAVVMRTPGDDLELGAGFALTEGVAAAPEAIGTIRRCPDAKDGGENTLDITLAPGFSFAPEKHRAGRGVSRAGPRSTGGASSPTPPAAWAGGRRSRLLPGAPVRATRRCA